MKVGFSLCRITALALVILVTTVFATGIGTAGAYEDALAVVEAAYGPIGDTNTAEPGGIDWQIIQLTIASKQLKNAGNDAEALAKISEALELIRAINQPL